MADPVSVREQALSAFFNLFAGLTGYLTKERNPNWQIDYEKLPFLVQFDGGAVALSGDDASSGISGIIRVALSVNVTVGIRTASTDDIGPALSAARAEVRAAVGADPILGGLVENVRWEGDEDPVMLLELGAPPHAVMGINFIIIHYEAELDPYLTV